MFTYRGTQVCLCWRFISVWSYAWTDNRARTQDVLREDTCTTRTSMMIGLGGTIIIKSSIYWLNDSQRVIPNIVSVSQKSFVNLVNTRCKRCDGVVPCVAHCSTFSSRDNCCVNFSTIFDRTWSGYSLNGLRYLQRQMVRNLYSIHWKVPHFGTDYSWLGLNALDPNVTVRMWFRWHDALLNAVYSAESNRIPVLWFGCLQLFRLTIEDVVFGSTAMTDFGTSVT